MESVQTRITCIEERERGAFSRYPAALGRGNNSNKLTVGQLYSRLLAPCLNKGEKGGDALCRIKGATIAQGTSLNKGEKEDALFSIKLNLNSVE